MTTPPILSIIVPVYNVASYLEECLNSIINQSIPDWELIVVNDGSTDSSLEILEQLASRDNRIHVISQTNAGYGRAINTGLQAARGTYIGIVESDDYIAPHMYERLLALAQQHNADMVKGGYAYFWDRVHGRHYEVGGKAPAELEARVICPREQLDSFRIPLYIWAGIYKRSWMEYWQIECHETPGASYQDNGFWFQTLSLAERAIWVNEPLYYYRQTNASSSIHKKGDYDLVIREYDFIESELEHRAPQQWAQVLPAYVSSWWAAMYYTYKRIAPEYHPDFLEQLSVRMHHWLSRGLLSPHQRLSYREAQFLLIMQSASSDDTQQRALRIKQGERRLDIKQSMRKYWEEIAHPRRSARQRASRRASATIIDQIPSRSYQHIALAADESFSVSLALACLSLIRASAPGHYYHIHLLGDRVEADIIRDIQDLCEQAQFHLSYHDVRYALDQMTQSAYTPSIAFARFLLPELLPAEVEKLVYLDADVMICNDISSLYEMDMGDHLLAASPQLSAATQTQFVRARQQWARQCGYDEEKSQYCNSGVLLFNVKEWRKELSNIRIAQSSPHSLEKYAYPSAHLMNKLMQGATLPLEQKFCAIPQQYAHDADAAYTHDQTQQRDEAASRPAILHLLSSSNPFILFPPNEEHVAFYDLWRHSPWKHRLPYIPHSMKQNLRSASKAGMQKLIARALRLATYIPGAYPAWWWLSRQAPATWRHRVASFLRRTMTA